MDKDENASLPAIPALTLHTHGFLGSETFYHWTRTTKALMLCACMFLVTELLALPLEE